MTPAENAAALWHTMWFHALEASRTAVRDSDYMTPEEGADFDMDAAADYNEWQLSRDFPAEHARHRAIFEACRDAMRLWGFDVPDDPDEVADHQTFDDWRVSA